nr:hypothetical protein 26 [Bacillaceae bacterium]
MLHNQKEMNDQMKGYAKFLKEREGYKVGMARFFALQMQDFQQSGMTPKDYFQAINENDKRAAETFLMNFKQYNQYTTNQYFENFHKLRWEMGRNHL